MKFELKEVQQEVQKIIEQEQHNYTPNTLRTIFSLIDLTTLKPTDNKAVVDSMCAKVNALQEQYPDMPDVAAICVYPSMVEHVKAGIKKDHFNIASVAAGFPASQTFLSIKAAETKLALEKGATEIDIVISLGEFLSGNFDYVAKEIRIIKDTMKDAHLKVIIESGLMPNLDDVYKASVLAINSGADFIKTSTGKEEPAATLEAIYVMAKVIKEHYEKTGVKIGLKPAGGISTSAEVFKYYAVVKSVLGEEWLNNQLFRIGASRLANDLMKEIYKAEGKTLTENYF